VVDEFIEKRREVMKSFVVVLSFLFVMVFHVAGYADETGTMSCNGGIVSIGDTAGEVVNKCGKPATTSQRERKDVEEDANDSGRKIVTTVTVDDWIFNFGPNQFQYRLTLENGRVASIDSLDYGY
jgi:hypothetical protein